MKWLSGIGKISKPKIKDKNKDEFNMNVTEIRRPADMERITTPELAKAFI